MTTDGTPAEPEPAQGPDEDDDVYSASEEDQIAARLEALGYID
jgi:hypothetical protein